jgi:hypothetical protein
VPRACVGARSHHRVPTHRGAPLLPKPPLPQDPGVIAHLCWLIRRPVPGQRKMLSASSSRCCCSPMPVDPTTSAEAEGDDTILELQVLLLTYVAQIRQPRGGC